MKRIGIVTIIDYNYGNRLQNYAVQEVLKKFPNVDVITLKNNATTNSRKNYLLRKMKSFYKKVKKNKYKNRIERYEEFNKNIKFSNKNITAFSHIDKDYDIFFTGSDQVWNPNFGRLRYVDLLKFSSNNKKNSFSASFGIESLPHEDIERLKREFESFNKISVREEKAKNILEEMTNRKDIEVLLDPTMLLDIKEWDKIVKKPVQYDKLKNKKYILNYFLGEIPVEWNEKINMIADKYDCQIINLLDKNDSFFENGPSEFLFLEKNAFLICTDSFHSSVFSILYNKPFIVFKRKDKYGNMGSRLDTLLKKFNMTKRLYTNDLPQDYLKVDYNETLKILEKERKKANEFLEEIIK